MMILFVVLSFVMVFILIWQQIQHKKLVREIDYITSRLDTISVISENGFVLIPTDNDSIKKLSAALNKLLQDFLYKKSHNLSRVNRQWRKSLQTSLTTSELHSLF